MARIPNRAPARYLDSGLPGPDLETLARANFNALSPEQQRQAIRRMDAEGWSDHGIAHAARIAVEQVRAILAEPDEGQDS